MVLGDVLWWQVTPDVPDREHGRDDATKEPVCAGPDTHTTHWYTQPEPAKPDDEEVTSTPTGIVDPAFEPMKVCCGHWGGTVLCDLQL